MISECFAFLCRFAAVKKRLWRYWYDYLAGRQAPEWTCMNYGYAGIPVAHTCTIPAELEPERWCLQLYHHVASGVPLSGRDVLEVGSGRGGGAAFVKQSLGPARYTGVDFSTRAVASCRERYRMAGLEFVHGDAENLPFDSGSFDVVINVESSHCYGDFCKFVGEAGRVLRPDGHFLYADFRDAALLNHWRGQLRSSSLQLELEADITSNVLAALEADEVRKRSLIRRLAPKWLENSFQDFAGTKGSIVERAFSSGEMRYFNFQLRKST